MGRFEEAPDYHKFRSIFRPHLPPKIDQVDDVGDNNNKENILYDIPEDDEVKFTQPIMKKPSKRRSLPLLLKRQQSVSQPWSPNQMQTYNEQRNEIIRAHCKDSLQNPTPAMTEHMARMQKRSEGLLPNFFTPRRKGLIAKRRLGQRKNSTESNDGDGDIRRSPIRRTTPSKTHIKKDVPSVRRSPRQTQNKGVLTASLGQHLYGIVAPSLGAVTNLVKSMFQVQTKLRPRNRGNNN